MDDFRAAVKAFERGRFGHAPTLRGRPAPLNRNLSDKALGAFPADHGGEHRAEPRPPEPNRFMADFNAALVQQTLTLRSDSGNRM